MKIQLSLSLAFLCVAFTTEAFAQPPVLAQTDQKNIPIHPDDMKLLKMIAAQDIDGFVAAISPELVPYLDRTAMEARLSHIARKLPDINDKMRMSVEPHPTLGRMETRIVFRSPDAAETDKASILILRDEELALLGIEIRSPGFNTTTLDALSGVQGIAQNVKGLWKAAFRGDLDATMAFLPSESARKEHIAQFVGAIRQMFGDAKAVTLQDIIITPPSRTDGEPRISIFMVIEKADKQLFLASENRFVINDELTPDGMKIGESVQANYVSQNSESAERFARVCETGSLENLAALFLDEEQAGIANNRLLGVFLQATSESAGKFSKVIPGSMSNLVVIEPQNMVRKVRFTASFENYDLAMRFEELFDHVESFHFFNDESNFNWMNTDILRNHWQPFAKKDLALFGKGTANEVLKMFEAYGGFDSVTEAQIEDIQRSFRDDLGNIKDIRGGQASFKDARWTYSFEVVGSKSQGVGSVVFGQSGFQRRLINIGIRVQ